MHRIHHLVKIILVVQLMFIVTREYSVFLSQISKIMISFSFFHKKSLYFTLITKELLMSMKFLIDEAVKLHKV